jgi:hypothetical protein
MNRTLVTLLFVCIAISACVTFAQAQAPAAAMSAATPQATEPVKDPVATGVRFLLARSQTNTLGAISAMPADKFDYKPTPEQMTFGHLVAHIVGFNNSFCAKAADVPAPKVEESKETDGKDKLLAAATASYDFCNEALGKMDDSKLGDDIELFGGRHAPRATADLILASGWADHYSTAAMYLRLNGILPPSAQPKKK